MSRQQRYQLSLKIYIVEDSPTVRDNLRETLEDLTGAVIVGASMTESDALPWLLHPDNDWEVVIVDIFLREGNGLSVLQALRGRPSSRKAVVLTNYATNDIRRRCLLLGADAVFDKSQEIDALINFCLKRQTRDSGSSALT